MMQQPQAPAANTFTNGAGTAFGYGPDTHCGGVADTAFVISNSPYYYLAGDTSGNMAACVPLVLSSSKNKGHMTSCTIASGGGTCAMTASVLSGAVCTATYDASTTIATNNLFPLLESVSGTILTVTASASEAGSADANYTCS